jgi:phenylalanyl-tRNA synthetase beta chain
MKFSEQWLREWVDPKIKTAELGAALTAAGLEVEAIEQDGKDNIIELGLTPNRGDCLSIRGVAREVCVITGTKLRRGRIVCDPKAAYNAAPTININLKAKQQCPRYTGRVIKNVDACKTTPAAIAERLEKAGVQAVSIIVDIANYVMLELGQPLHAFDLDKLQGDITVRMSKDEEVELLDGTKAKLGKDTLVICDDKNVLAAAGVMGTLASAVSESTKNIFLESAYFDPNAIAGKTRQFSINSDAAQRFERGVDFELAPIALERVTDLILQYAGGEAGPVCENTAAGDLPERKPVRLLLTRLNDLLGTEIAADKVANILQQLEMQVEQKGEEFIVTPPSHRFDIGISEDLIEEVARIHGYNNIPEQQLPAKPNSTLSETAIATDTIKQTLIDRGYHEVITYSFVDSTWQNIMFPEEEGQTLLNPISQEMNIMRVCIWPGLLKTLAYNQNRQQPDMRIFEIGQCFRVREGKLMQNDMLAGLISGQCYPLHWKLPQRPKDFYDAKGDLEALLELAGVYGAEFVASKHNSLHPGQTADIMWDDKVIGAVGALNPRLAKTFSIKGPVFLYEIELASILRRPLPQYQAVSKFPAIRRDLALVVDDTVTAEAIRQQIKASAGTLLTNIQIFDVYQGENIAKGKKSIALGLILQDFSHTLIDEEVNKLIQTVIADLEINLQATVRE